MKFKNLYVTAVLGLFFLFGCGSQKSITFKNYKTITANDVPLKNGKVKENELKRWSHLDIQKDTIPGMSVDRAYTELLKGKKGQKVIVAVIDSGTDIEHNDLKDYIWTNTKEIPNNNIDDDNNGYIDDIHGWNFLGESVNETLEMTRIVKKGDDGSDVYKRAKELHEKKLNEALQGKQQIDFILAAEKAMANHIKKEKFTLEDIKAVSSTDPMINQYKMMFTQIFSNASRTEFDEQIEEFKDYVYDQVNYNLNVEFDGRKPVGDNPYDYSQKKYGNNNVIGPSKKHAKHGTHVAGIIAQGINNGIGGDGVTNEVELMILRAVPNGDEYDKDIALAIRYAADNGAKVINGSFGKSFSPNKEWVYEAIKYAESKDVLIVHAAGNDAEDLNENENYPNDRVGDTEITSNFINVGALAKEYGTNMVASFSNYGKKDVDVFAPGSEIYATVPNQEYKYEQGTSMASPNVAGVAAVLRSYFPQLKANQIKEIIKESGIAITKTVAVGGDSANKKPFADLSVSGKIVNLYNALLLASKK